jgi:hypothetical protein
MVYVIKSTPDLLISLRISAPHHSVLNLFSLPVKTRFVLEPTRATVQTSGDWYNHPVQAEPWHVYHCQLVITLFVNLRQKSTVFSGKIAF